MGMNVSIPCGQAVVLDVPEVTIGTLVVKGLLTLVSDNFLYVYLKSIYFIGWFRFFCMMKVARQPKNVQSKVKSELYNC